MIIATSTTNEVFTELGNVSSEAFSGVLPFLYLVIGIALAFFIVETITFWFSDYPERYARLEEKNRQKK